MLCVSISTTTEEHNWHDGDATQIAKAYSNHGQQIRGYRVGQCSGGQVECFRQTSRYLSHGGVRRSRVAGGQERKIKNIATTIQGPHAREVANGGRQANIAVGLCLQSHRIRKGSPNSDVQIQTPSVEDNNDFCIEDGED